MLVSTLLINKHHNLTRSFVRLRACVLFRGIFLLEPGALAALMAVNEGEVIFAICSRGHGKSSIRKEESQELKVEAYRVLTR